jgi:hypothetical protein
VIGSRLVRFKTHIQREKKEDKIYYHGLKREDGILDGRWKEGRDLHTGGEQGKLLLLGT